MLLRFAADRASSRRPGARRWSPQGFVAYSRVCTHAGCPVAQYEDQAQVLVCPCHQSTFDVLHGAKPIVGPAGRPLPQLPLAIDAQGDLRARRATSPNPSAPASGTRDERAAPQASLAWRVRRERCAHRRVAGWLDRNLGGSRLLRESCATSSRTTGRSSSARSRCTASSCSSSPASTWRSSSTPSRRRSSTTGSYQPLQGVPMSDAYRSVVDLSFDVRAGLLVRQVHHWAALVFVGALVHAPGPHVLHRRLSQAAPDQLAHRPHAPAARRLQRLHRLLGARRPALGHRPAHRLLHHRVHPADRSAAGLGAVRRQVPHRPGSSRASAQSTSSWCRR